MEKQKLCGSTSDLAEMIVDYKNKKTDIKGVPEANTLDTLKTAFSEWSGYLILPLLIVGGVSWYILEVWVGVVNSLRYIVPIGFIVLLGLTSCHLNSEFDRKVKRWFAIRTGKGKRNRIKITNFKTKEFVLYGINNIVAEYEAKGDVSNKLNKIWIKEEHPSASIRNQANVDDMLLLENNAKWNCYFIFEDTPVDGSLYVEWI